MALAWIYDSSNEVCAVYGTMTHWGTYTLDQEIYHVMTIMSWSQQRAPVYKNPANVEAAKTMYQQTFH